MQDEHALKVRDLARKFDEWEARNQNPKEKPFVRSSSRPKRQEKEGVEDDDDEEAEVEEGEVEAEDAEADYEEEEEEETEEEVDDDEAELEDEDVEDEDAAEGSEEESKPSQVTSESADSISRFGLSPEEIAQSAAWINVAPEHVRMYSNGVRAYAFVKQNSGMLKPIQIFFQPRSARLFIVRKKDDQIHSLYIHLDYFQELNSEKGALQYLSRNSVDETLVKTVSDLGNMPHMVIWTNDQFSRKEESRKKRLSALRARFSRRKPQSRRSLVFVFEEARQRDTLCLLLEASAAQHKITTLRSRKAADWSL